MKIKRLCRQAYYVCFCALSKVCLFKGAPYPHEKCVEILKSEGYDFRPLWNSTLPLQPDSIDLSIIIPIYNRQEYLPKCLDSILSQNSQYSYEVICIDDGSTDGSGDIMEQYKKRFPDKLICIHQENKGIATTRNIGITAAKGEYIGFIDSDDYVSENYIDSILRKIKDSDADLVQTGYCIANTKGDILSTHSKGNHILDESNKKEWVKWVQGFVWGGCYRKSDFKMARFPDGFWYEDMATRSIFMRQCKKIVIMSEPLYYHLVHPCNVSISLKNNIRTVDQYWLAKSFADYLINGQHTEPDDTMYEILSHEWSGLLYSRTKSLQSEARKAAFYLASEYIHEIGMDGYVADIDILREAVKGLVTKNYHKWMYASMAYTQYSRIKR